MTEEEEQQLRELGADLAAASAGAHEPHCVALAFASRLEHDVRFTMQAWIDLEVIRSPMLRGEAFSSATEIEHAGRAFGLDLRPETVTDAEAVINLQTMREAISAGFSMGLKMRPSEASTPGDAQGMGTWLPIFACLVKDCGIAPAAALQLEVGQAFAIIAGVRHNQGWIVEGTPYALRDVGSDVGSDVAGLSEPGASGVGDPGYSGSGEESA